MREGLIGVLVALTASVAAAAVFPDYLDWEGLWPGPAGVARFGLYGWDNPAGLALLDEPDLLAVVGWEPEADKPRWGLFMASPRSGFGVVGDPDRGTRDYRVGLAPGGRKWALGFSYGWATGPDSVRHATHVTTGFLLRPRPWASLGAWVVVPTEGDDRQGVVQVGLRPLRDHRLAVFSETVLMDWKDQEDGTLWGGGVVVEPWAGIRLVAKYSPWGSGFYDTDPRLSASLQVSLGRASFLAGVGGPEGSRGSWYGVRLGGYERTSLGRGRILKLDAGKTLRYRRRNSFDRGPTLMSTLQALSLAAQDPKVEGVAVGVGGLAAGPAMTWELRDALAKVRQAGKRVTIFAESLSEREFMLASVADRIVLDPQGVVFLKGFVLGGTYLRGALDAMGIGVDEWRLFTYKSAFEQFSRHDMSEGQREQLQRIAEGFMDELGRCVGERGVEPATFQRWMEEGVLLSAQEALAQGMVDRLGRWADVDSIIRHEDKRPSVGIRSLAGLEQRRDDTWSQPPTIAVIYALGACAMDEGITARKLVHDLAWAERDRGVKAVVFRVDSPGGDPLASDVVAEALRRIARDKPVIVSQGQVAASGGYWLSMYGTRILTTPWSLTGSIGVIGGWFYNQGAKEKLRLATDKVQVGTHADLGFGFRLPFLGVGIPDRNLTPEERERAHGLMRALYRQFVDKVAQGRNTSPDRIETLAQGRVWLGRDALAHGLVDSLGGLLDAIALAKNLAGIAPDEPVRIVERPRPPWFSVGDLVPWASVGADPVVDYLRLRVRANGKPLVTLDLDSMEAVLQQEPCFR